MKTGLLDLDIGVFQQQGADSRTEGRRIEAFKGLARFIDLCLGIGNDLFCRLMYV